MMPRAGGAGGREQVRGVVLAYVATLPRASADTDHSRQMKSFLFLTSYRQGAATGVFIMKQQHLEKRISIKRGMTTILFPTVNTQFNHKGQIAVLGSSFFAI